MYLEIDEGFVEHPKTIRLRVLLHDDNALAYPLRLWSWACRNARDGRLDGLDATAIEMAVRYRPLDGACFRAMVDAWFIDVDDAGLPTEIHNWKKRSGARIERMAAVVKRRRDYHAGRPWPDIRLEILGRDKWCCIRCGVQPEDTSQLEVHHIRPLRCFADKAEGNHSSNLTTLCTSCHAQADREFRHRERSENAR